MPRVVCRGATLTCRLFCLSPFAPPHSSLATCHLLPHFQSAIRTTTPQRDALTRDTRACRAARWRANKIRNHHRYFRLSISVLDKLMTTTKLCAGGKVPGGRRGPPLAHPPQIETRFSHRSFHLHLRLCNISRPHDLRNFRRQLVALASLATSHLFRHLQSAIRTPPAHAKSVPKSHSRQREPVSFPRSPAPRTPHVSKLNRDQHKEQHPDNIERRKSRCRPVRRINETVVDYRTGGPDHQRSNEPPAKPSHSLKFFSVGAIHHDSAREWCPPPYCSWRLPFLLKFASTIL